MTLYQLPDIRFAVPAGTVDQSIIVLTLSPPEATPFSVSLTRIPLPEGKTLAACVVDDIRTREDSGSGYEVTWQKPYHHDGATAFIVAGLSAVSDASSDERKVYIEHGRTARIITAVTHGRFTAAQLAALNDFMKGVRVIKAPDAALPA